jgi:hypothetical protein
LHADTPPRYLSDPVIQKKWKLSVTRCFFGHFKVESRVTSVAWADASPSNFFYFYCSKLVFYIRNIGKFMLKVVLGRQKVPKKRFAAAA